MNNVFLPNMTDPDKEQFDTLLKTENLHIEKITSNGQTSSQWYEQDQDEWVLLLEGEGRLLFEDKREIILKKGEFIHIEKMKRHKVTYTASPTVWLAIHF